MLIVDGKRRVLVDDGVGPAWSGKHRDMYGIDHSGTDLDRELQVAGLTRADITGRGAHPPALRSRRRHHPRRRARLPNATYHLQRRH